MPAFKTLISRNMTSIVSEGRHIKSGNDSMAKLGTLVKKPFAKFTPKAFIRYLMYLPLNFIPVVGSVLFVILQGAQNNAPLLSYGCWHPWQGSGWDPMHIHGTFNWSSGHLQGEMNLCINTKLHIPGTYPILATGAWSRRYAEWQSFISFGVASVLLELVPFVSIIFAFTNTVGAALWAADIEREETTSPNLKDQARKAEWDLMGILVLGLLTETNYDDHQCWETWRHSNAELHRLYLPT